MRAWLGTRLPRLASWAFDSALWRLSEPASKQVCLTIDDGPTPDGTERLLEVLERHQVRATFFLVGRRAERWPGLVQAIAQAGHQIGNHSYFHGDAWRQPAEATLEDFDRGADVLADILGTPVDWVRPPYGHLTLPLIRWSRALPQRLVMWDVVAPDYERGVSRGFIHRWLGRFTRPGSIVCLHDNSTSAAVTPRVLDQWIPRAQDAGFEFALVPSSERAAPSRAA